LPKGTQLIVELEYYNPADGENACDVKSSVMSGKMGEWAYSPLDFTGNRTIVPIGSNVFVQEPSDGWNHEGWQRFPPKLLRESYDALVVPRGVNNLLTTCSHAERVYKLQALRNLYTGVFLEHRTFENGLTHMVNERGEFVFSADLQHG